MRLAFTVASLVLLGSLALFVASRRVRTAVTWSTALGLVLGFWVLAPMSMEAHRLYPQSAAQWVLVLGVFAVLFLVVGTVLALLTSAPLALADLRAVWRSRNPQAAAVAWSLFAVPAAYLAAAAGLELTVFPRVSLADDGLGRVGLWGGALGLAALSCLLLYRALARRDPIARRWIVAGLSGALAVGAARLVLVVQSSDPTAAGTLPSFAADPRRRPSGPLLVIGLDGGNWKTMGPLIEAGRLPTFADLARGGVSGTMRAMWPPYWSTPAWGSIITGHHQRELGVYENLGATAPGLPSFELPLTLSLPMNPLLLFDYAMLNAGVIDAAPADRRRLKRPPVWERLPEDAVRSAVIYFPFSYPAVNQADYVVSNRAIADIWEMMGIRPGDPARLVSTRHQEPDLTAALEAPVESHEPLRQILPGFELPAGESRELVEPTDVLRRAFDVGERMFSITRQVVSARRDLDLVMLYVGDFDSVGHAFWRYRFPGDYPGDPPSSGDVERLGPVMDRYLEHIDRRLGELIAAFPTPPNVIVVSDHGMEASDAVQLWRAWHSPEGIFMAAGPDVRSRAQSLDVSYLDVAPTIVDLLGFAKPADLSGRSLVAPPP